MAVVGRHDAEVFRIVLPTMFTTPVAVTGAVGTPAAWTMTDPAAAAGSTRQDRPRGCPRSFPHRSRSAWRLKYRRLRCGGSHSPRTAHRRHPVHGCRPIGAT